jgi:ribosomal protein L6P/L9E
MVKFGHDLAAGQAIGMQQGNRAVTAAAMPQVSNSISLHQHNSISVNGNDSQNLGQSLASSGTQFFAQELAKAGIMTGAS